MYLKEELIQALQEKKRRSQFWLQEPKIHLGVTILYGAYWPRTKRWQTASSGDSLLTSNITLMERKCRRPNLTADQISIYISGPQI